MCARLSEEMLCACLKEIKRFDVLEIIQESEEEQGVPPAQVFVSYQWDSQSEAMLIRSQVLTYYLHYCPFCLLSEKDFDLYYNVEIVGTKASFRLDTICCEYAVGNKYPCCRSLQSFVAMNQLSVKVRLKISTSIFDIIRSLWGKISPRLAKS